MTALDSRNSTGTLDETDLFIELEKDFGHDAQCNLNHDLVPNLPCSVIIAAVGTACETPQINLCANAYAFVSAYMALGHPCPWCGKPAKDCWKVNPA
jgi:hypothetical protein